jgi:hypothetical protein
VGISLLGLALLILMLTRWGQVKPISKCIVLSVFAHLLLMASAYCVRTFHEAPLPQYSQVVQIKLTNPQDQPDSEVSKEQPLEPTENLPWNDFSVEPPVAPESLQPMERQQDDSAQLARMDTATSLPLSTPVEWPAEIHRDLPTPPEWTPELALVRPPPADLVSDIKLPEAKPVPQPAPEVMPNINSPQRMAVSDATTAERNPPAELPADLLAGSPTVQRLTDLPFVPTVSDAAPSEADLPNKSANRNGAAIDGPSFDPDSSEQEPLIPIPIAAIPPAELPGTTPATGVRRPADGSPLPTPYQGRTEDNRAQLLTQHGGNQDTEAAVQAALDWLAANQEPDGRWDPDRHNGGRENQALGHDRGGAGAQADTGITALAVLAFLGTGQSHLEGKHKRSIQRGLEFLLRSQAADGNLAGNARLFARMYCHGMASLAISEAYAMTGDARLQPYVQRAIGYTVRAQNPSDGGWRYQPRDPGDMSQFGWQLMAVRSAGFAGIAVPESTQRGMRTFLRSVRCGQHGGLASYRPQGHPSVTMTAEALTCRLFMGVDLGAAATREAVQAVMQQSPEKDAINLYYWYYATIALFQIGGPNWDAWNSQLQRRLLGTQEQSGDLAGSWSPNTVWGSYGGRVYSTAMAALCLEVYYRYLPVLENRPS